MDANIFLNQPEPSQVASANAMNESLEPDANDQQIMITLEDGSVAMLDPDSLAQLLSSQTSNVETQQKQEVVLEMDQFGQPLFGGSQNLNISYNDTAQSTYDESTTIMGGDLLAGTTIHLEDPSTVMVNMADIQPGQTVQTGEVLWEGFPDLTGDIVHFA